MISIEAQSTSGLRQLAEHSPARRLSARSIRAVVILAGVTGRLAQVRDALRRNLVELPRGSQRTLLADWCERFRQTFSDAAEIPIHVAIDESAPNLASTSDATSGVRLQISRDAQSSRGTAGIVRDLTAGFDEHEHVLVLQASDLAWRWSSAEADELVFHPADIVLSADQDLRPAGLMRVRCGLLRRVPSVGFVDLKEQFLARCAGSSQIHVLRSEGRQAGSLHTLSSYLTLVGLDSGGASLADARAWQPDRSIIEPSAVVDPSAILFHSVILGGAQVGRGAVVVRSLVGAGAIVPPGAEIVDRVLVIPPGRVRRVDEIVW